MIVSVGATVTNDEVMHLSLNADVVVVGKRTFVNLADVENPAEDLVGSASSASQGAITAKQLGVRPFMRQGEVLETVPGVIITQHSSEATANQYILRGFNLDHGSDFAMTVAGTRSTCRRMRTARAWQGESARGVRNVHQLGAVDRPGFVPEI